MAKSGIKLFRFTKAFMELEPTELNDGQLRTLFDMLSSGSEECLKEIMHRWENKAKKTDDTRAEAGTMGEDQAATSDRR